MTLGVSIVLLVLGLILAFAVDVSVSGIDLQLIGLILAGAGLLGLVLYFTLWAPGRRAVAVRRTAAPVRQVPVAPAEERVVEERRYYEDDGPAY